LKPKVGILVSRSQILLSVSDEGKWDEQSL